MCPGDEITIRSKPKTFCHHEAPSDSNFIGTLDLVIANVRQCVLYYNYLPISFFCLKHVISGLEKAFSPASHFQSSSNNASFISLVAFDLLPWPSSSYFLYARARRQSVPSLKNRSHLCDPIHYLSAMSKVRPLNFSCLDLLCSAFAGEFLAVVRESSLSGEQVVFRSFIVGFRSAFTLIFPKLFTVSILLFYIHLRGRFAVPLDLIL